MTPDPSHENRWSAARVDQASLAVAIRLLRSTVVEPWESVDQVLAEHGRADFGDPLCEGTAAWHFRHIVEIFRVHVRTVMEGLGDPDAAASIAPPDAAIPRRPASDGGWSPKVVRDELLADVDRFANWLAEQPEAVLARPFAYGSPTDLTTMFSVMQQHITWHAAAVHYWFRWRRGDAASKPSR
jgi:hypothetical protein